MLITNTQTVIVLAIKGVAFMTEYKASVNFSIRNPITFERLTYKGATIISCFSVLYLLSVFATGISWFPLARIDITSSDLILSLIQCLLGVVALKIPMLITKFSGIKMPDALCTFYYIFILCATVLGEMFSLYYAVPFWDVLLHFSSGVMLGISKLHLE